MSDGNRRGSNRVFVLYRPRLARTSPSAVADVIGGSAVVVNVFFIIAEGKNDFLDELKA